MLQIEERIMKKIFNKLFKKNELPPSSRITNETVAQHRERILAGGRRFKYPVQYARHKLVINAILISISALIIVLAVGWWQLYSVQNTSEFMYRITKVLPIPVASVDGQTVLYSDYLMKYLSSVHYLEQKEQVNLKTDDGKSQLEYIKQQSMQDAIADAYAVKLARELNISVSDSELEGFIKEQRQSSDGEISEQTYNAVILDYYGWSPTEYRRVTKAKLLRQKVSYQIDKTALKSINSLSESLKTDPAADLKTLADTAAKDLGGKVDYGVSGWVPRANQDGGKAIAATKLEKSQISPIIKSTIGDGYYIVKLLDSTETQVSYAEVHVLLTEFSNKLNKVISDKKIDKYISIKG